MKKKYINTYNLPGYGTISYQLYPYTKKIYNFLESHNHIKRLKSTNQLGVLRNIFPGAHHNRFEYVITQFFIITELCNMKGPLPSGISVSSSNNKNIKPISNIHNDPPSKGDLIQSLVLLSNIGHLPNTFADERAFLHFLKNNLIPRRKFKEGLLTKDLKQYFDFMLETFDIYNFHYFLSIFMINRYKRKKGVKNIINLCQNIIKSFIEFEYNKKITNEDEWSLYKNIRRLTIIALDSLYTPVPFSLDLNSIFRSLDQYIEKYFKAESEFQYALQQLEEVLNDSVYLNPKSILTLSNHSKKIKNDLESYHKKYGLNTITNIKSILIPKSKNKNIFTKNTKLRLNKVINYVSTTYQLKLITDLFTFTTDYPTTLESGKEIPEKKDDRVNIENKLQKIVGKSYSKFGLEWDPSNEILKVVGGLTKKVPQNQKLKISLKIAYQICKIDLKVENKSSQYFKQKWRNGKNILNFLFNSIFNESALFRFSSPFINRSPIFINRGSTKVSNDINDLLEIQKSDTYKINRDELNEINMVIKTLKKIKYRGMLLAFVGSTKILNKNPLAEFDGIIFLLGNSKFSNSLIIVEGKNTDRGNTKAKRALKNKMNKLNINNDNYNIFSLKNKGAYLKLDLLNLKNS